MEFKKAKRWAIYALVAEIGFLFLSIVFGFWLLAGVLIAGLIAFGLGIHLSVVYKRHRWLLASVFAISIPVWAVCSIIFGLSRG